MPFFANKIDDENVDKMAREGGSQLAQTLAHLYEMVGFLEHDDSESGKERLNEARKMLQGSTKHFTSITLEIEASPVYLERVTPLGSAWLAEPIAWLERRGIDLEKVTDQDLFSIMVDGLLLLESAFDHLEKTSWPPNFSAMNAFLRTVINVQYLALGVTAFFEFSRSSRRE